jgi:hypothetical protein
LDRLDSASAAFERAMAARHMVLDDLIEILAAQLRWR